MIDIDYDKLLIDDSLAAKNPEVAGEWHPTLNGTLTPSDVKAGSNKIVWWRCHKDNRHEWEAEINMRNKGNQCPHCLKWQAKKPEIEKEWDEEKNKNIDYFSLSSQDKTKYFWKCPKGHEYVTSVYMRLYRDKQCESCLHDIKVEEKKKRIFDSMAIDNNYVAHKLGRFILDSGYEIPEYLTEDRVKDILERVRDAHKKNED